MISIIICSRNFILFEKLKKSIEDSIGIVEYEIIKIDNKGANSSITQVYNRGIKMSKYDLLLFIHEDVLFHTINWGIILIDIFKNNSQIGLVGIAGAKYKSKNPSAFWHTKSEMLHINLIQHYRNKCTSHFKLGFKDSNLEKVVAVDGVFLALRKSTNVQFNEKIEGFHCYDLGISVDMIEKKYEIAVTNQILIEHFSIGNTNLAFVKGVMKFHKSYKNTLPKYINKKKSSLEVVALKRFLEVCLENRFIPYKFWVLYLIKQPFTRLNFNLMKLELYKLKNKIR
jgi:hypothetical protein